MKKIFFLLLISPLFVTTAHAQDKNETLTFSLQQAIEYAYLHQKDVLNAQLDEQIAHAKVKETIGMGLPQIGANFDVKGYFVQNFLFPQIFTPGGDTRNFAGIPIGTPSYGASAGVQVSQLLFDGGFFVGLNASKTYRELSQKNLIRTKIETAVAVSKAYYYVLVSRERMKLLEANVVRVQKLKEDTKALFDNGFVEKIDYDRVALTYNNIVAEKENVTRLLKLGEYMLNYQVGLDINSRVTLTDSLNADQVNNLSVSAEKPDVTTRIEYTLLRTQQRLQELDLKRNRSSYFPSVVLYGNLYTAEQRAKLNIFDSGEKWYPTGFVGGTLTWTLFDGLQRERKIDQAKLAVKKIDTELSNTMNALNLETESNRTGMLNAINSFNTQKQNLELAGEVVKVSKLKYDQGVGSNLEVINAETSLKEAQTNYYSAMYDALVAKVELDKALGAIKQ